MNALVWLFGLSGHFTPNRGKVKWYCVKIWFQLEETTDL